jgi:osmotically-inducible protein OsmY
MTRRAILVSGVVAAALSGCSKHDSEALSEVGRRVWGRCQNAAGGPDGKAATSWQGVRAGWNDANLDSRVYLRFRWDQQLSGANIQVKLLSPGVIEIGGPLAEQELRSRAVEIAQTTLGVEKVEENWEAATGE